MTEAASTIVTLLRAGADDAPALNSPGGVPLTYRPLRTLVSDTTRVLGERGIGPGDRVAIVPDVPTVAESGYKGFQATT